jgi:hypothetical protein
MRRSDYQTTRKEFSQSNAWMLPDLLQILNDKTARGGHSFGSYSKAYCRPPDPSDLVPHRGSLCILVAYLSPSRLRRNREAVLEWTNLAISLKGHRKTGHTGSLQKRPWEVPGT